MPARRDLYAVVANLGILCRSERRMREAGEYLKRALEISVGLEKEVSTLEAKSDLANSYSELGWYFQIGGKQQEAKECLVKALDILEKLDKEIGTPRIRRTRLRHRKKAAPYKSKGRFIMSYSAWNVMYGRNLSLYGINAPIQPPVPRETPGAERAGGI